jgi:LysR family nod box-dependent transcriptional activator
MDFAGLDLNLFVALDALFAEMSVSRAGERLHLSQSATSGALARLRKAFHDPLLVPVGRKMTLTPLAKGLVEPVRDFLLQAEAILNTNPAFNPAASTRKFRMMLSDYVQTVVMTEVLPRIEKLAPGVTLELISNVEGGSEELDRGEIDLAITPARYLSAGHPSERLFEDEFTCLVWSGNAQVDRGISLETYLSLGHVVVRFGRHQQIPTFDEWFVERFGRERRIEVVTTAFNLVPQLLIGTSRIATLHRGLAIFYERYLPLKLVAPPVEIPRLEEYMQWHKSRDRDPGTVWLRSMLKSALGAGAAPRNANTATRRSGSPGRTSTGSKAPKDTVARSKVTKRTNAVARDQRRARKRGA